MTTIMKKTLHAVASLSFALWLTACNSLLDVTTPGRVAAETLNDPSMAVVLESAAMQQFQCAFEIDVGVLQRSASLNVPKEAGG